MFFKKKKSKVVGDKAGSLFVQSQKFPVQDALESAMAIDFGLDEDDSLLPDPRQAMKDRQDQPSALLLLDSLESTAPNMPLPVVEPTDEEKGIIRSDPLSFETAKPDEAVATETALTPAESNPPDSIPDGSQATSTLGQFETLEEKSQPDRYLDAFMSKEDPSRMAWSMSTPEPYVPVLDEAEIAQLTPAAPDVEAVESPSDSSVHLGTQDAGKVPPETGETPTQPEASSEPTLAQADYYSQAFGATPSEAKSPEIVSLPEVAEVAPQEDSVLESEPVSAIGESAFVDEVHLLDAPIHIEISETPEAVATPKAVEEAHPDVLLQPAAELIEEALPVASHELDLSSLTLEITLPEAALHSTEAGENPPAPMETSAPEKAAFEEDSLKPVTATSDVSQEAFSQQIMLQSELALPTLPVTIPQAQASPPQYEIADNWSMEAEALELPYEDSMPEEEVASVLSFPETVLQYETSVEAPVFQENVQSPVEAPQPLIASVDTGLLKASLEVSPPALDSEAIVSLSSTAPTKETVLIESAPILYSEDALVEILPSHAEAAASVRIDTPVTIPQESPAIDVLYPPITAALSTTWEAPPSISTGPVIEQSNATLAMESAPVIPAYRSLPDDFVEGDLVPPSSRQSAGSEDAFENFLRSILANARNESRGFAPVDESRFLVTSEFQPPVEEIALFVPEVASPTVEPVQTVPSPCEESVFAETRNTSQVSFQPTVAAETPLTTSISVTRVPPVQNFTPAEAMSLSPAEAPLQAAEAPSDEKAVAIEPVAITEVSSGVVPETASVSPVLAAEDVSNPTPETIASVPVSIVSPPPQSKVETAGIRITAPAPPPQKAPRSIPLSSLMNDWGEVRVSKAKTQALPVSPQVVSPLDLTQDIHLETLDNEITATQPAVEIPHEAAPVQEEIPQAPHLAESVSNLTEAPLSTAGSSQESIPALSLEDYYVDAGNMTGADTPDAESLGIGSVDTEDTEIPQIAFTLPEGGEEVAEGKPVESPVADEILLPVVEEPLSKPAPVEVSVAFPHQEEDIAYPSAEMADIIQTIDEIEIPVFDFDFSIEDSEMLTFTDEIITNIVAPVAPDGEMTPQTPENWNGPESALPAQMETEVVQNPEAFHHFDFGESEEQESGAFSFESHGLDEEEYLEAQADGIQIVVSAPLMDEFKIMLIYHNGVYSLMVDNGENAALLKAYETNPMEMNSQFVVTQEAILGNKMMFIVQVGDWQGIVSLESDEAKLQAEI